jgi:hypothetical protein
LDLAITGDIHHAASGTRNYREDAEAAIAFETEQPPLESAGRYRRGKVGAEANGARGKEQEVLRHHHLLAAVVYEPQGATCSRLRNAAPAFRKAPGQEVSSALSGPGR